MYWRSVSARNPGEDDGDEAEFTTFMQRTFSPALTHSTSSPGTSGNLCTLTPSGVRFPTPRPPSRSKIPLPSVHVSSESRPSSTMTFYRPESPLTGSGKGLVFRAQTPEAMLEARMTGSHIQRTAFFSASVRHRYYDIAFELPRRVDDADAIEVCHISMDP